VNFACYYGKVKGWNLEADIYIDIIRRFRQKLNETYIYSGHIIV